MSTHSPSAEVGGEVVDLPGGEVSVAIIGAGGLGLHLAQRVVERFPNIELWLIDRDGDSARRAAQAARGFLRPSLDGAPIHWHAVDVLDSDALDNVVGGVDVVVNAVTRLPVETWWQMASDSRNGDEFNALGFGPWLSLHLVLADGVTAAVARSARRPWFINAAYPDVINAILARWHDVVPLGFGNLRLLEAPMRVAIADRLGLTPSRVEVAMAAHYVHLRALMRGSDHLGPGLALSVSVDGEPLDFEGHSIESLYRSVALTIPPGEASHPWTAATFVADLEAILGRSSDGHMPGPMGKIGGYPVTLGPSGVELRLPPGWDLTDVEAAMDEAGREDGVEGIDGDHVVHFTEKAKSLYRTLFGATLRPLSRADLAGIAEEQLTLLKRGFAN